MMGTDVITATMSPAAWYLLAECVTTAVESGHAPMLQIAATVHGATVEVWGTVCGVSRASDGAVEFLVTFGDGADPVTVPAAGVIGCDWP